MKKASVVVLAFALSGCTGGKEVAVGSTYTIVDASGARATSDWPCFADRMEFDVWSENTDPHKLDVIEQNNALWLEPGDTVKVLQRGAPGDPFANPDKVRIVSSPATGEAGKTCWADEQVLGQ